MRLEKAITKRASAAIDFAKESVNSQFYDDTGKFNLGILESFKHHMLDSFQRIYLESIKPSLTASDKHMPMAVRRAIHEVVDTFWIQLMKDLPDTIDGIVDKAKARRRERRKRARYEPMLHDETTPADDATPQDRFSSSSLPPNMHSVQKVHVSMSLACGLAQYKPERVSSGLAALAGLTSSAVLVRMDDDTSSWSAEHARTCVPVVALLSVPRGEAEAVRARLAGASAAEMAEAIGHSLLRGAAPTIEIESDKEESGGGSSDEDDDETHHAAADDDAAAPPASTTTSRLGGCLLVVHRMRVFLLYHFLPFDQSVFGRLSTVRGVGLQLVASFPLLWVRAAFFSVFLGCMLVDLDEFLLMKYILLLKGSQAFAGVLHAVRARLLARNGKWGRAAQGRPYLVVPGMPWLQPRRLRINPNLPASRLTAYVHVPCMFYSRRANAHPPQVMGMGELWYCAVVSQPPVCDRHAPGAGDSWLREALVNVWLQTLVYALSQSPACVSL